MKKITQLGALAVASLLALSACAEPPSETSSPGSSTAASGDASSASKDSGDKGDSKKFKACMVSDFGGFEDKSFNETSYNGLMRAKDELGIETGQIESNAEGEYAGNIQSQISAGCNMIITVGFALANATEAAAKQNPDIDFAIVDFGSFEGVKNAKGLLFDAAQPGFLAGYSAAAMTKSGKVGTYGGAPYPTVTIFMTGFAQGVKYHNEQKGTKVQVLGWQDSGEFLATVDVLAVPSQWAEVFGLVTAEAMAAGVPVVASDAGAVPEVVGSDHPFVVPQRDAAALANCLRAVRAIDLGAVAHSQRRRWESLFSPEAGRAAVAELLDDLSLMTPAEDS